MEIASEVFETKIKSVPSKKWPEITNTSIMVKCIRAINITQKIFIVNVLLLCYNITSNPGPAITCPTCLKVIKRCQPRVICLHSYQEFHLKCIGQEFETTQSSDLCYTPTLATTSEKNNSIDDSHSLPVLLKNVRCNKIIHQNIGSLTKKIMNYALSVLWI